MRYYVTDTDPKTGEVVVVVEVAVTKEGQSDPRLHAETLVGTGDHVLSVEELRRMRGGAKALGNWRTQNDESYEAFEKHSREASIRREVEEWAEVGREPGAIALIERDAPFEEILAYYEQPSENRPKWWTTEEEREAVHKRLEAYYASGRLPA